MAYIGRQNLGGAYRQLDDISSGFDGSDTTHTMQVNSTNVTVGDVNQIILSLGGVIQKPGTDFTVSGSVLTFTTAPAANTSFFAILLGSDNGGTTTPTDASVTASKLASDIAITTTGASNFNNNVTISIADNTDALTLTSTDADATNGPGLRIFRNSASPADDDDIGRIIFSGENDASEQINYAIIKAAMTDVTDGTEEGDLRFEMMAAGSSTEFMRLRPFSGGSGETVFNDGQVDINFRVESDNSDSMLKVDAGTDCVIVGGGSRTSDAIFNVQSSANAKTIEVDNTNASLAQDMLRFDTTRSGHSAFNFLRMMSGNSGDSEFIMTGEGNMYADGTFNANGADYAEFFETNDGNVIAVGKTVVLDGNKVRASTSSDDAATVIGVVRPKVDGINSMIVGNTAWNSWTNRYLHDDYGRFIMEDYTVTEWETGVSTDGVKNTLSYDTDKIPSDVTVPSDAVVKTQQRKKANPDYDKSKEYKSRAERDEWVIIGMLGQIQITKGQKTGTNWIKMKDISDTVEEWLVR